METLTSKQEFFSCPTAAMDGDCQEYHFDGCAELELETGERKTIPNEIHLQLNKELCEEMWEKSRPKAPTKRTRSHEKVEQAKSVEFEKRRKEALSDMVKIRRTYSSHPDEIRLRQEIRTRRDHNKDWIRRWQDKSCKFRTLNLNNMMNINKVDQEQLRLEDMMNDVLAMKKRFEERMKEREARIADGSLDPNFRPGPIGLTKAEKMINWMRKVQEVVELAETDGLDIKAKMGLFQRAIVRMAARQNGIVVTEPLIKTDGLTKTINELKKTIN